MKKVDKNFTVRKTLTPKGQRVYTIFNFFGEKVAKTTSWNRDYVALYIIKSNEFGLADPGKYDVLFRFSRWDLVGKGDSRHWEDDERAILVKVEDQ